MSQIRFNIEPLPGSMAGLSKHVRSRVSTLWARRVMGRASAISKDIGDMLVSIFNNTQVAQALRGHGSEDLPAHFGLDDITANALADGMAGLIKSSVRILSRNADGSVSIRIQAVEKNWQEYLNLPGAQYLSQPSNITIPVAKWLLIDPTIDIGQAVYDIVFEGEDSRLDMRIQRVSRSGRAIMVALQSLGGGGGYVLPAIIAGQAGQNFIEYALGQQDIVINASNILMRRVI